MMLLPSSRFFGARSWLRPDVRTVQDVLLQAREFRLTDVHGRVIHDIVA